VAACEAADQPERVALGRRLERCATAPGDLSRRRRQRRPAPRARVEVVQVGQPAFGAAATEDVQTVADRRRRMVRSGRGCRAATRRVELLG